MRAVYYNTRTREALVASKSALLNTEGARKSNRGHYSFDVCFCFLGIVGGLVAIPAFSGFRYNSGMTKFFITGLMFVFLVVCGC